MSSQLVDMNDDGFDDLLAGSFEGVPYIMHGSNKGLGQPEHVVSGEGERVLIQAFWDFEKNQWSDNNEAGSEGHCTSVSAVDWDNDGDLDLILGDYYGGRLYLRKNLGTKQEPKFAEKNEAIEAGGKPMVIAKGLAAPRVVDWDGDGNFDILCGGSKGGVFFFRNTGTPGNPIFSVAKTLIEPVKDPSQSYLKRVPTIKGGPALPGSSFHIEPVDYDGDGDLDLLVGARSSWLKENVRELSDEEKADLEEARANQKEVGEKLKAFIAAIDPDDLREAVREDPEYKNLIDEYRKLASKVGSFDVDPTASGDFVWLFRRKQIE